MQDRRQPLGGVTKETYVDSGGDALTYDLIRGMKDDLCHELGQVKQTVEDMKQICSCRVESCTKGFDRRYIKRAWAKVPASWPEVVLAVLMAGVLIGMGVLTIQDLIGIVR